ncbi:MAG: enoyl-CoA hydratase-related protein [Burkholderiaceae bacterium]|nr:enoyl-CoA hydratase-related protein [Burkholderiaceae bacterium]
MSETFQLPDYETIQVAQRGEHVLVATMNRPQALNAVTTQMGHDWLDLWTRLTVAPANIRCVVLTGAGERAFCAGGDLKERNGMTNQQWQTQHELFERAFITLLECTVPVIAAVNGHAYGGGCETALACDFIYASRNARFALSEVKLGIMPGGGGTQNLARAVGERRAKELIMSARPFTPDEACEWGMVNRVFDTPAELLDAAVATADEIAGNAPLSIRQVKKSIHYGLQCDILTGYRLELEAYNRLVPTQDRLEGVLAFNEKRKPVFRAC